MNRNALILMIALMTGLLAVSAFAQDDVGDDLVMPGAGYGVGGFIDENGDGFNDLAPDADGDGIPNGMDEDFVRPEDGTGSQFRFGQGENSALNGLGSGFGGSGAGNHYGIGDGTGTGVGPADGTGFGPGTGDCLDGEESGSKTTPMQGRGGRR